MLDLYPNQSSHLIFHPVSYTHLNDRNLVAFGFQLERTHAVGQHIVETRLEYAEFGQRLESGHGVLIEQLLVAARHARDVFRLGAGSCAKSQICLLYTSRCV